MRRSGKLPSRGAILALVEGLENVAHERKLWNLEFSRTITKPSNKSAIAIGECTHGEGDIGDAINELINYSLVYGYIKSLRRVGRLYFANTNYYVYSTMAP